MSDITLINYANEFVKFRDSLQLVSDCADEMLVDLSFESTMGKKTYSFRQDEVVRLKDIIFEPKLNKIIFEVSSGSVDKRFTYQEAELIEVYTETGKCSLVKHIDRIVTDELELFNSFDKMNSLLIVEKKLQAIFDDPHDYVDKRAEAAAKAGKYAKIEGFGRY